MAGRFTNLEFRSSGGGPEAGGPGLSEPPASESRRYFDAVEKSASYYLDQAVACEMSGELEDSLRAYSAALGEDAQLLDAWVGQLWILLEHREYPEVELWSRKALAYFPENPSLLAVCSLALHRMSRQDDARAMNDNAMGKEGNIDIVWLSRGEIMIEGKRATVEECFNRAKRVASHPGLTRLRIASVCAYNKKYQLALQELMELTSLCSDSARVWAMLGVIQGKLGFTKKAVASLTQAIELAPGNPEYKIQLNALESGFMSRILGFFRRNR